MPNICIGSTQRSTHVHTGIKKKILFLIVSFFEERGYIMVSIMPREVSRAGVMGSCEPLP